jgi:hypothetical protein
MRSDRRPSTPATAPRSQRVRSLPRDPAARTTIGTPSVDYQDCRPTGGQRPSTPAPEDRASARDSSGQYVSSVIRDTRTGTGRARPSRRHVPGAGSHSTSGSAHFCTRRELVSQPPVQLQRPSRSPPAARETTAATAATTSPPARSWTATAGTASPTRAAPPFHARPQHRRSRHAARVLPIPRQARAGSRRRTPRHRTAPPRPGPRGTPRPATADTQTAPPATTRAAPATGRPTTSSSRAATGAPRRTTPAEDASRATSLSVVPE